MYKAYFESPIGILKITCNEKEVIEVYQAKKIEKEITNELCEKVKKELLAYFQNKKQAFNLPLRLHGTVFQNQVWQELLKIPFGELISYQELANRIGKPRAVRAVANAVGANKLLILVPCHRIIGSNKSLTGFATGLESKIKLLNIEDHQIVIKKDMKKSIIK